MLLSNGTFAFDVSTDGVNLFGSREIFTGNKKTDRVSCNFLWKLKQQFSNAALYNSSMFGEVTFDNVCREKGQILRFQWIRMGRLITARLWLGFSR